MYGSMCGIVSVIGNGFDKPNSNPSWSRVSLHTNVLGKGRTSSILFRFMDKSLSRQGFLALVR